MQEYLNLTHIFLIESVKLINELNHSSHALINFFYQPQVKKAGPKLFSPHSAISQKCFDGLDETFIIFFVTVLFILFLRNIFRKINISYPPLTPLIRTRTCGYQGIRNVSFSDNFAYEMGRKLLR